MVRGLTSPQKSIRTAGVFKVNGSPTWSQDGATNAEEVESFLLTDTRRRRAYLSDFFMFALDKGGFANK